MSNQGKVRVLIAEDDYLASEMIKVMLEEAGYTVAGRATDGQQAVEMTTQLSEAAIQPDVVLMDIDMPDMDGIKATRLIQERCPTPVVMLTAYETEELVAQASAAGAGAYLVKPPDAREMKRAITIAMARFDDMAALRQSNRRLEETLAQLEKMQQQVVQQERLAAVGQLAAGIAHEFNNIMASIILGSDVMLSASVLQPQDRERLVTIRRQGRRAANLTQQILDFGRRAVLRRQDLDLLPFMERLKSLLQNTLSESINIHLSCEAEEGTLVDVDPARLQQAIMNLALNAQEAMPKGGDLDLTVTRLCLEPGEPPPKPGLQPGEWVRLTVTDTGSGIPPDVLPHIFEPFFTTKAPFGSGLGLSQTYGIVKQHEGHIDVRSKVNEGTTFVIYLPALPVSRPHALALETTRIPRGNGETILVVEDGPYIRKAIADSLDMLNYRALAAGSGREALALLEQHGDEIALVLSELVMPLTEDITLCQALKERYPVIGILILTNYPPEAGGEDLVSANVVGWVQKPVSLERLAQTVARALNVRNAI
jgi:two-component system cell cycle sensor histidine kinase/response regulator CckA